MCGEIENSREFSKIFEDSRVALWKFLVLTVSRAHGGGRDGFGMWIFGKIMQIIGRGCTKFKYYL